MRFYSQLSRFLFCRSWIAITSLRRERGVIVFFPRLKLLIAHSASLDRRDRSLVENCFVSARICSKYFGSTTPFQQVETLVELAGAGPELFTADYLDEQEPSTDREHAGSNLT